MNKITTEEVNDKIEDNLADTEDFEDTSKTLAELKAMAKDKGIKGYSTMKKDELLKNLK